MLTDGPESTVILSVQSVQSVVNSPKCRCIVLARRNHAYSPCCQRPALSCFNLLLAPGSRHASAVSDVTRILDLVQQGDSKAAGELLPFVYGELRKLAAVKVAQEKPGQTLQATALVHEAWLKIAGDGNERFANRRHFFKAAASAMQQILIDNARRKQRLKHGANQVGEELHESRIAILCAAIDCAF